MRREYSTFMFTMAFVVTPLGFFLLRFIKKETDILPNSIYMLRKIIPNGI